MTTLPSGGASVMAQRREPPDSLDFFPTPPFSTRALVECVLGYERLPLASVWEPAAGEGHMAEVLREYFGHVHASDVHDYGKGYDVGTFVGEGADRAVYPRQDRYCPDWIITNPPFNLAVEFAERAMGEAGAGVALLLRTSWLETADRYTKLFSRRPPAIVAVFAERVPMAKGRWDPDGSTATSYSWFIWKFERREETRLVWIPPGQREALTRPDDRRRFAAAPEPSPLFAEATT